MKPDKLIALLPGCFLLMASSLLSVGAHAQALGMTWEGDLILFDPDTAVGGRVGGNAAYDWQAMATSASGAVIVATYGSPTQLFEVDPQTFALSPYGSGPPTIRGLAGYPFQDGVFFSVSEVGGSSRLHAIDTMAPSGTVVTLVGTLNVHFIQALTFDDAGRLFGHNNSAGLLEIDIFNTTVTNVSGVNDGNSGIQALAFNNGVLYGIGESVYVIDRVTGIATLHAAGSLGDLRGAEFVSGVTGAFNVCPGSPNSTGGGASLTAGGSFSIAANALVLNVGNAPAGQFGYLLAARTEGSIALGGGTLCLSTAAGQPYRILPASTSSAGGQFQFTVDLTSPPLATAAGLLTPGHAVLFQTWYRDPIGPGGNNLSAATGVIFAP